jgi:rhodanese-related sulfurtransferase
MKAFYKYHFTLSALIILFLMSRCSHDNVVQDINPAEAQKMIQGNINNPEFVLLDVRTPGEFTSGHIAGAINIDFNADEFESKIGQLDKNKQYLVYCRTGHRSSRAVAMMKDKGFKSLKNLDGGLADWIAGNLPVVTQ